MRTSSNKTSAEIVNDAAEKMKAITGKYKNTSDSPSVVANAVATMEEIASRNKQTPKKNSSKIINEVENPKITSAAARMLEIANRNKK